MTKRNRKQKNELKVYISSRESRCDECGENLGHGAWILFQGDGKRVNRCMLTSLNCWLNGSAHQNIGRHLEKAPIGVFFFIISSLTGLRYRRKQRHFEKSRN
jgi:hypothetical protein